MLHSPVTANPRRGRGDLVNGRGSGTPFPRWGTEYSSNHRANRPEESQTLSDNIPNYRGRGGLRGLGSRGGAGRGGNPNALGGQREFTGGRGGGFRGRGRGQGAPWNTS